MMSPAADGAWPVMICIAGGVTGVAFITYIFFALLDMESGVKTEDGAIWKRIVLALLIAWVLCILCYILNRANT